VKPGRWRIAERSACVDGKQDRQAASPNKGIESSMKHASFSIDCHLTSARVRRGPTGAIAIGHSLGASGARMASAAPVVARIEWGVLANLIHAAHFSRAAIGPTD
jgi:hypothetical protein